MHESHATRGDTAMALTVRHEGACAAARLSIYRKLSIGRQLNSNQIKELPPHVFDKLTQLQKLYGRVRGVGNGMWRGFAFFFSGS